MSGSGIAHGLSAQLAALWRRRQHARQTVPRLVAEAACVLPPAPLPFSACVLSSSPRMAATRRSTAVAAAATAAAAAAAAGWRAVGCGAWQRSRIGDATPVASMALRAAPPSSSLLPPRSPGRGEESVAASASMRRCGRRRSDGGTVGRGRRAWTGGGQPGEARRPAALGSARCVPVAGRHRASETARLHQSVSSTSATHKKTQRNTSGRSGGSLAHRGHRS